MKVLMTCLMAALLAACAAPGVQQYKAQRPALDLAAYFNGTTDAWGMFQRRGGEVAKRFHVVITGASGDGTLTLDEQFSYDDGTSQRRVWHLTRAADGRWLGRADDVKGEAVGELAGNAFRWQYTLHVVQESPDLFRLPAPWAMTAEQLAGFLAPQAFTPCTSMNCSRQGWIRRARMAAWCTRSTGRCC
jgi:hypothetical protein